MGRYVTVDDLKAFWPETTLAQLTDDNRTAAREIKDDILELAIAWAEDQADAVFSRRYPVPLAVVPGIVKTIILDGALYRLYQRPAGAKLLQYQEGKAVVPGAGWLDRLAKAEIDLPEVPLRTDVRVHGPRHREAEDVRRYY